MRPIKTLIQFPIFILVALTLATATSAQVGAGQVERDRILHGTTYQERLALLWVCDLRGEIVVVGKTFRPAARHRVTLTVSGQKVPGRKKKEAQLMALGSSARENPIEELLLATYPLTVRATFRVPERLPKQGRPAILKEPPAPGTCINVFCSLTGEELMPKCVAQPEDLSVVDSATCMRLAEKSESLDSAHCAEQPELSPAADLLELQSRE